MVRAILPEDYSTLCQWWTGHDLTPVDRALLPEKGWIVDSMAAAFLYQTDSALCMVDALIVNPDAPKGDRRQAMEDVLEHMLEWATKRGFKAMLALNAYPSTLKYCQSQGFTEVLPEVALFIKELKCQ